MNLVAKIKTAYALGVSNIAQVGLYRLKKSANFFDQSVNYKAGKKFFSKNFAIESRDLAGNSNWLNKVSYFGQEIAYSKIRKPNWHSNPITGAAFPSDIPWWKIPDFNETRGDIKLVWEASRFDWVISFSQKASTGDDSALNDLNEWLADWCTGNHPYLGVNWKCGQEAGIRVIRLAIASIFLNQARNTCSDLLDLIEIHLVRISQTLRYAMAQDNNHGSSEAAALFIGGNWLFINGRIRGKRWQDLGRHWLENRVKKLIQKDGSFSQHSVNYHRLILDTLAIVELWKQKNEIAPFTKVFYERAQAAVGWLKQMVNPSSGDAPNIGANDGALLLPLYDFDYRDYRPSLYLSSVLFCKQNPLRDGEWDNLLNWFSLDDAKPFEIDSQTSQVFDDGGYAVLRAGKMKVIFRYPRFKFRPSHMDALHIDLWFGEKNILRDGGSFSYCADEKLLNYFSGVASHNTIQFDGRSQMPRLSRFLLGDWLKTVELIPLSSITGVTAFGASYQDSFGAFHKRMLFLSSESLTVVDHISGFKKQAVMRWRLIPDQWTIDENRISNSQFSMYVKSSESDLQTSMTVGFESRYYLYKTELPVFEVLIGKPCTVVTEIVTTQRPKPGA